MELKENNVDLVDKYQHPEFTKDVTLTLSGRFVSQKRFDEACDKSISSALFLQDYRITKIVKEPK